MQIVIKMSTSLQSEMSSQQVLPSTASHLVSLQSVESRCKARVSSQCSSSSSHSVSQSSPWSGEQRRPSVYSHSPSSQVNDYNYKINPLNIVGRAEQLAQGDYHGGSQGEGCHVYLAPRGEGGVTPAYTPTHAVHAQLCRHVVDEVLHHLQLQERVPEEGGVSLVYINSAIASARINMPLNICTIIRICLL